MRSLLDSDFLLRVLGGFAIGVFGFFTLVPASASTLIEAVTRF